MDLGLEGRRALVAAASSGLGAGIATTLASEGCIVEISSRSLERASGTAERIATATGSVVRAASVDVAEPDAVREWVDGAAERMGGLDIVVPNAGGPSVARFDDTNSADWDRAYTLTLRSAMTFAEASRPHMGAGGAMLFLTSGSVREPNSTLAMSSIFRAGVASLAKLLANDWASAGIRVNHLVPGRIATERVESLDRHTADERGLTLDEVREASAISIPLGRYGTTDEFGAAAAFLVSPAAGFITGATLQVDGGALKAVF